MSRCGFIGVASERHLFLSMKAIWSPRSSAATSNVMFFGSAHQETTLLTRSNIFFISPSTCSRDIVEFARFSGLSSIWMSFSFMSSLLQFPVDSSQSRLPTAIMRSAFLRASLALECHQNQNTPRYLGFEKSAQRFPIGPVMIDASVSSAKFVIAFIAHPQHPWPR